MDRLKEAAREFRESLKLLRTRRFGTFWFASLLSSIGTWAQQVAEPWLLMSLGASSFLIGFDSFAMNAPVWILTILGGVLADRFDRRRVITIFQSIQMLCPTLIAILLLGGTIRASWVIGLSFVVGITDALSMPSFQSIVPLIVERGQIGRGLALNSTQFNLSRILGPAIAGVLMATVGAVACFVLSAASYLPFIGVAHWILPRGAARAERRDAPRLHRPFSGLRTILGAPGPRGMLFTVLTSSVLLGPLVTFSPVLVRSAYHGDAGDYSTVVGSFGVGGLLGAIGLLFLDAGRDRRRWSSRLALVFGGVVVAVALLPRFAGLPVLMAIGGAAMTISNTCANSFLQSEADSRLLGQTTGLFMLAMRGGISIGSVLTGLAIDRIGVRHALLANGAIAMVIHLLISRAWRRSPSEAEG